MTTLDLTPHGCPFVGDTVRFTTQHDQHADRNGHEVLIVRYITEPDDTHDAEVLPMAVVLDRTDQVTFEAWVDELGPTALEHLWNPDVWILTRWDGSRPRLSGSVDWSESYRYTYRGSGLDDDTEGALSEQASEFIERRIAAINLAIRVICWLPFPRRRWWKRASS